ETQAASVRGTAGYPDTPSEVHLRPRTGWPARRVGGVAGPGATPGADPTSKETKHQRCHLLRVPKIGAHAEHRSFLSRRVDLFECRLIGGSHSVSGSFVRLSIVPLSQVSCRGLGGRIDSQRPSQHGDRARGFFLFGMFDQCGNELIPNPCPDSFGPHVVGGGG